MRIAAAVLLVASVSVAAEPDLADVDRRSAALASQADAKRQTLRRRLRALYRLDTRGTPSPALAHLVKRDLDELAALEHDGKQIASEAEQRKTSSLSWTRPVTGAILDRSVQGDAAAFVLEAKPGERVRAVAAGTIVRIDTGSVEIAHAGGARSIVSRLDQVAGHVGDAIATGDLVGLAATTRISVTLLPAP